MLRGQHISTRCRVFWTVFNESYHTTSDLESSDGVRSKQDQFESENPQMRRDPLHRCSNASRIEAE